MRLLCCSKRGRFRNVVVITSALHAEENEIVSFTIILKNFKLHENDPETAIIFSQLPLTSFICDKNITYLSGAHLSRFILNTNTISGPKRSVQITDRLLCTSANVICCIICTFWNKLFIGETGGRMFLRTPLWCWEGWQRRNQSSSPALKPCTTFYPTRGHLRPCISQWWHGKQKSGTNISFLNRHLHFLRYKRTFLL